MADEIHGVRIKDLNLIPNERGRLPDIPFSWDIVVK